MLFEPSNVPAIGARFHFTEELNRAGLVTGFARVRVRNDRLDLDGYDISISPYKSRSANSFSRQMHIDYSSK
jgi:hypothetical protein